MKKRIAVVAIAALMAGSLTNVGTVSAAEPTEITFWHYMSEDKEGKFVNEAIEEFNNSQDEVHVTAQYLPREELMKQYTIGVVSGELPDCGMVDNPDHASYASMGVFEDITDLYNSWDEADFMEGSINSCYYDDKLYGLPWGNNCLGLFYNKSMLEEAGVEVPTTWSELEAACEKLTTDTCKGLAISAIGNEEGTFQYMPWLLSAGGSVDNLTSDESKESMTYLKDLMDKGYISKECINWTQADAWNQFCAGKAAFAECGTWHLAQTDAINGAFEYDFTLLPTGDEGTSTSTIGGENFGVCKGSENKEACAKFLEWLCSQENEAKWAAVGGKIPTRQDATAEYTFEQDGFKVFTDEMNYAQARGPHAEWPSISEAVYTATQSVIVDGTSAKDALETAAAKINPIVEETPLPESN